MAELEVVISRETWGESVYWRRRKKKAPAPSKIRAPSQIRLGNV